MSFVGSNGLTVVVVCGRPVGSVGGVDDGFGNVAGAAPPAGTAAMTIPCNPVGVVAPRACPATVVAVRVEAFERARCVLFFACAPAVAGDGFVVDDAPLPAPAVLEWELPHAAVKTINAATTASPAKRGCP
jgi:hypothetical protein